MSTCTRFVCYSILNFFSKFEDISLISNVMCIYLVHLFARLIVIWYDNVIADDYARHISLQSFLLYDFCSTFMSSVLFSFLLKVENLKAKKKKDFYSVGLFSIVFCSIIWQ